MARKQKLTLGQFGSLVGLFGAGVFIFWSITTQFTVLMNGYSRSSVSSKNAALSPYFDRYQPVLGTKHFVSQGVPFNYRWHDNSSMSWIEAQSQLRQSTFHTGRFIANLAVIFWLSMFLFVLIRTLLPKALKNVW